MLGFSSNNRVVETFPVVVVQKTFLQTLYVLFMTFLLTEFYMLNSDCLLTAVIKQKQKE